MSNLRIRRRVGHRTCRDDIGCFSTPDVANVTSSLFITPFFALVAVAIRTFCNSVCLAKTLLSLFQRSCLSNSNLILSTLLKRNFHLIKVRPSNCLAYSWLPRSFLNNRMLEITDLAERIVETDNQKRWRLFDVSGCCKSGLFA